VLLPQIIAHRGNKSVAPENTLPAFASALRAGTQSIEMDVVLSRDGVAMVIHDETLDGTTSGAGAVAEFTAEQIQALDAGAWFHPAFSGVKVPTFNEFADLMVDAPEVEILLEFKGDWSPSQAQLVVDAVVERGLLERTILQSFSRVSVESLLAIAPGARRGVLTEYDFDELIGLCTAAGICTLNPDVDYVLAHPEFVAAIHDAGMKTMVWTANEPAQWQQLVELSVDGIITDRPDALAGWYAGLEVGLGVGLEARR